MTKAMRCLGKAFVLAPAVWRLHRHLGLAPFEEAHRAMKRPAKVKGNDRASRGNAALRRARANQALMKMDRLSVAAMERGEKPIPWDDIRTEAAHSGDRV